ncbi:nucleotide-binding universal stress UspA family protein [Pseudochelatococcus lubricantis]|uniref:Universal stress protein n=1 Tax=Pseudochelatococcus lubricantis TaxID=1538102 RepID=A0ABX0V411_9HYPH|nr:universal stress protein [Pseudochelatococcus lubricantis]NIJ59959.1 nucleotide-binding universal stress UspA family protein [Pseudochelatococcus lubricantis]
MYKHILIATDGSELAGRGIDHGLALAKALNAKVTVLSVTHPLQNQAAQAAMDSGIPDPFSRYDQQVDADMQKRFAAIEKRAAEQAVTVELAHEIDDYPAEAIVRFAKLRDCDLIVMSSHGRRGARRLVLGSQTAEVVTHTTIPVLVIR